MINNTTRTGFTKIRFISENDSTVIEQELESEDLFSNLGTLLCTEFRGYIWEFVDPEFELMMKRLISPE